MINPLAKITGTARPDTLEDLLDAMSQRGMPRLSRHDTGWYCCIEMFVSATGADFKIASEFKHPTHVSAARECYERMLEALAKLGAS